MKKGGAERGGGGPHGTVFARHLENKRTGVYEVPSLETLIGMLNGLAAAVGKPEIDLETGNYVLKGFSRAETKGKSTGESS